MVRLHESKVIYLENLRVRCFKELNLEGVAHFSWDDYNYIVLALEECRATTRSLVIHSVKKTTYQIKKSHSSCLRMTYQLA